MYSEESLCDLISPATPEDKLWNLVGQEKSAKNPLAEFQSSIL